MRIILLIAAFVLSPALAFADDLRIGVAGPLSGGMAAFGEQIQHGVQIAADEWNAKGGLLGHQITVKAQDDACDPKQARNVADKMIADRASVVFGHWCSAASMAASTVYGEEGVLQIDVGAIFEKLTQQGFSTIFRISGTSKSFAEAMGRVAIARHPGGKIAIVTDQPAVTKETTQEIESYFSGKPETIVDVEDIRTGDKDFSSVIDKLTLSTPDIVICSCYTVEAGLLARQLAAKSHAILFLSWDTVNSPDFLHILGGTSTKNIFSVDYSRAPQSPELSKLATELDAHGWPLETTTLLAYAGFQIYAAAVERAQSLDSQAVAAAIHRGHVPTILGDVAFTDNGDRINPAFSIYQWIDGKLAATGPVAP